MTRGSPVVSTITKLSEDTDRRLTASAGYDSLVQFQVDELVARPHPPDARAPARPAGQDLLHVVTAERFAARERQLERGAFDVIDEDVQVVGIDERPFRRGVEKVRRVADDELIERRAARHHDRGRSARAAPGASGALPRRGNRARIAGHDADVERADVDAELERIGGHDRADAALAQPLLDLAAPVRQVAAAVSADALRRRRARSRSRP